MINVDELFPRLAEIYTEEGVQQTYEVALIIEKMCANISADDIRKFLRYTDGGQYYESFTMLYEIVVQKMARETSL